MLINILTPNFEFEDERGKLVQLIREGYKQFNIIFSNKNVERGDHYHKENSEAFYIITGKINLRTERDGILEEYTFTKGDMFEIPPFVIHSFYYTEDTWLASMYSNGVELANGEKDIYTE